MSVSRIFAAGRRPMALHLRRAGIVLALVLGASQASTPVITSSVIANGGGRSDSPGGCFRIEATVGQAIAGFSSAGAFTLTAGFLPGNGDRDSIFNQGFEVCS